MKQMKRERRMDNDVCVKQEFWVTLELVMYLDIPAYVDFSNYGNSKFLTFLNLD